MISLWSALSSLQLLFLRFIIFSEVLFNTIISQDNFFRLTQIDLKSLLNRHYALLGLLSVWINERMNQVIYGKDVLVLLVSSTCLLSANRNQEMRLHFLYGWNFFSVEIIIHQFRFNHYINNLYYQIWFINK